MGTLITLVFIGAVVAFFVMRRGEALRFETQAFPGQVVMAATATIAVGKRWSVAHQSEYSVTFTYVKPPSKLIALIGLMFFFVPGLVYLVLAGKHETLAFQIDRSTGITLVQATSNGFRGKSAARAVRSQLALAGPAAAPAGYAQPLAYGAPIAHGQQAAFQPPALPGPYGAQAPNGQHAAYGQPMPYGQPHQYGAAPQYDQAAQYGAPPQYGQGPQYGQAPQHGYAQQYEAPQYGAAPQYGQAPTNGQHPGGDQPSH